MSNISLTRPIKRGTRGIAFGWQVDSLQEQVELLAQIVAKRPRGGGGSVAALVLIETVVGIGLYRGRVYPGDEITGTADISTADLGTIGTDDVLLFNLAEFLNDGSAALDPAADDNVFVAHSSGITSATGELVYVTFVRQSEICSSPTGTESVLSLNGGY